MNFKDIAKVYACGISLLMFILCFCLTINSIISTNNHLIENILGLIISIIMFRWGFSGMKKLFTGDYIKGHQRDEWDEESDFNNKNGFWHKD